MSNNQRTSQRTRIDWATSGIIAAALFVAVAVATAADKPQTSQQEVSGEEIFRREWIPNDPRSHGGDGLGPVFNESSCVACHNLGGVGGAGPVNKNVSLVTAVLPTVKQLQAQSHPQSFQPITPAIQQPSPFANPPNTSRPPIRPAQTAQPATPTHAKRMKAIEQRHKSAQQALVKLHPDFQTSTTIVIHRFGTSTLHENWRRTLTAANLAVNAVFTNNTVLANGPIQQVAPIQQLTVAPQFTPISPQPTSTRPGPLASVPAISQPFPATMKIQSGIQLHKQQARADLSSARPFQTGLLQFSQRNTTALFGAGLIDAIPTTAIEAAAKRKYEEFPEVTGRIHRLKGDKIGRFGWKAQEASLYDFTMTACAVEVGLHVPDHAQSAAPYQSDTKPAGLDLNRRQVGALVDYIKLLPRPEQSNDSHAAVSAALTEGEELFTSVGCVACHTKKLGEVDALFSDLLLHDMGPDLGSIGSYGVPTPSPEPVPLADAKAGKPKPIPPSAQEWRTPPLWGVRDSAPYLHDGRAATLEQAIALHGGEAADARLRFFMQSHERRQKIITFLKSLTAPNQPIAKR